MPFTKGQRATVRRATLNAAGIGATCTTHGTLALEAGTHLQIASGSALDAISVLTEQEKSRLAVIKREVGRGYAVTIGDLRFVIELLGRCGL